ncbi:porin [Paraburkholderia sp. J12]|uniref:porin n=1 Tax=Paraburkholderia sp. J12 TaxID=2805432 RepID=UPI002ABDDBA1|nr:porin [Paraburkholderia sp. J12]
MKRATVVLCGVFVSTPIWAQSSVTLYGAVDDGFTFTNNQGGSKNYQLSNGALGSSKWGILVNEDLGGGLHTVARLENGFDINSGELGNDGRLFGRQAYVGLGGGFGTLTLGRQYDLVADALMPMAATLKFAGTLATHAADVDNIWGDYPLSNVIKYNSPVIHGFKASGLFSLGGVAGAFSDNRTEAVSLGYSDSALAASAVFSRINNPATALYYASSIPQSGSTFSNPITNPTFSGYVSARTLQTAGAGLNYKLGGATIGAVYTNVRFEDVVPTSSTPFSGTASFNNYEINGTYLFTPALTVGVGYTYTKAETAKYNQINFGTEYQLSKRTGLYATAVWEHASGTDSTGKPATAALAFITPSSTPNQVAVRVGVRHVF